MRLLRALYSIPWTVILLLPLFIITFSKFEISQVDSAAFFISMCLFWIGLIVYIMSAIEIEKYNPAQVTKGLHAQGAENNANADNKVLVTSGIYSYVRNPPTIGIFLILLGEAFYFQSALLGIYAFVILALKILRVVYAEEAAMQSAFGEAYEKYSKRVPRWIPLPVTGKKAPKESVVHPPELEKKAAKTAQAQTKNETLNASKKPVEEQSTILK